MKEKIKVREDISRKAQIEFEINSAINLINGPIKTALESIGFELSSETLKDCYEGALLILKQYQDRLSKDLAGISTPSTRSMLESSAQVAWRDFNNIRQTTLDKVRPNVRPYLTVEDGFAVFGDDAKGRLEEDCSVYLTNPEEIELYQRHLAACEALNEMFGGYVSPVWSQLFDFKDGQFIPESNTEYGVLMKKIKENGRK